MNTGGPAFPAMHFDLAENEHGMTLRDYFAARAMDALITATINADTDWLFSNVAETAYNMADAMLKAREE
jgi:hypothetical protein